MARLSGQRKAHGWMLPRASRGQQHPIAFGCSYSPAALAGFVALIPLSPSLYWTEQCRATFGASSDKKQNTSMAVSPLTFFTYFFTYLQTESGF